MLKLKQTRFMMVSIPRSGHHLLERFLRYYYEKNNLEYSYCEFYKHCNRIPCINNSIFQKNHDWDLSLPITKEYKYIVMYRGNIIEQLESFYRHNYKINSKENINNFFSFFKDKNEYYIKFLNKWLINENKNIIKIEYNEFVNDYFKILCELLKFIFKDNFINTETIHDFVEIEKINKKNNVSLFDLLNI